MSTTDPRVSSLISALGAHVGIADLEMNDDNVCRLVLDGSLVIDIEHLPGGDILQAYSAVGGHPGGNAELCHHLLSANLFGRGTGGAVLGLDEQRGEILLVHTFDLATLTQEKFVATLEGFVGYVQSWTAELLEAAQDFEEDDEDEEAPAGGTEPAGSFIRV